MKSWSFIVCVGLGSAFFAPHIARAQDRIDAAKQRWDELTPEERAAVQRRFEELKRLSPEERKALKARHDVLRRLRVDEAGSIDEARPPRKEARELPPKPLRARLNARILEKLDALERSGGGPKAEQFRAKVQDRVEDELLRLEEAGVIDAAEAERILALPPHELASALRAKMKDLFFRDPPPKFLNLPEDERKRLEALPPDEFGPAIHAAIGPPPGERRGAGGPTGPAAPPRGPLDAAQDGEAGLPPRPFIPKEAFERFLTQEQRAEVERLDKRDRRKRVMQFMHEHARARLIEQGADPRQLDDFGRMPAFERELRMMKILDPNFTPPPRPERFKHRGDGRGPGRGPRPEGPPPARPPGSREV
ncbi:MAG: DUF3106 domain-containing protein [Planctomycetes bacterium]|nr:DUF3106 domain-containing protein [Planctomycetota bacterium]MCC7171003.1 DUF3106 domain-containing protein [Planctomycetota bacterium]